MNKGVNIGTCGFHVTKEKYSKLLSCVEVQHTFYQPPQIKTLERWRAEIPEDFEFTLKAWQLITHEAKSPTYRRLKKELSETEKEEAGFFKPTETVKEAWEMTLACANALKARTILFQCPASFRQNGENIANLEKFFSTVKRGKLNFCWEPRGATWNDTTVKDICKALKLWHVVDPFVRRTLTPDKCYFRLHGRTGWRYKYEEDELEELVMMLPKNKLSYVFFNNIYMTQDAQIFQEIIKRENL
jgi:uncharacterized protein YecE (DUF72 family)